MAPVTPAVVTMAPVPVPPAVVAVTPVAMPPAVVMVAMTPVRAVVVMVAPAVLHRGEAVRCLDRGGGERRGLGGGRRREERAGEREGRQSAAAEGTGCGLRGLHGRSPDRVRGRRRGAVARYGETGSADLNTG
ncbi:hypothetical protein GCM10007886_50150 [Methylobacterium gregans]|nr:hypothetical protein GCM10007886_50150 [Methylobacterium gregans]